MGLPKPLAVFTVDEYLALERTSEERHEYLDGQIWAMAGESLENRDISVNLVISLGSQLKGKPCRALSKDTQVRSGPVPKPNKTTEGLYSFPDLVVICGDPHYHDDHKDVILNPTVIIEVLSPSTEAFDRGEKFARYRRWNPTLRHYLLVSQDKAQIEQYSRQAKGTWSYRCYSGLKATVPIRAIRCKLKMGDVYDRVVFPTE